MRLIEALGVSGDDVVALVGGGGKTSAMFRLAREIVDKGGSVITTTTTRIFAAQIALAPSHVPAADATRERVAAALAEHRHTLVVGATNPRDGKADGISLELFTSLRRWFPGVAIVNEADGSRMRAFKAPAAHEPVIPAETTLVVPVVGADILGKTLDAESVHRPELVSALSGASLGSTITPEVVARVLAHRDGGLKAVPGGARVVVVINKVETLADRGPAYETAERLLRAGTIELVVFAALRTEPPVLEVFTE